MLSEILLVLYVLTCKRAISIQVKPGKEERLLELLKAVSISANSKNEPGCLTYRLTRKVDGSQVIVYEEYVNEQALLVSLSDYYKCLSKSTFTFVTLTHIYPP